ncbi:MAG: glycosyltransferase family 4 protein [Crocinitomicaceae bacterium]|nr:glycosyltransferase family 4 protein [Crocinitomicaceae bacterium]
MRIAVNVRFLLRHKMEGFGWYTYETISRMVKAHPEHEFIFFFDRPFDQKFVFGPNVKPVILRPPARHPLLFKIWFNYSVTRALKKYKVDLFFSPDGYLSLKSDIPQIGVIHDLNFEHYPQDLPASALTYLRHHFPLFAHKAKHLLTVSEYSKQDIIDTYKIQAEKITVAHNGASHHFKPISMVEKHVIMDEFTQGEPFIVFVGALHPRKNVVRLIEAFDRFKQKSGSTTKLLIVGENLWRSKKLILPKINSKDEIVFTGHQPIEKLAKIVASAKFLAFVSYFEGFGIPLVEAMQAGCPLLAGDKTSLPEVAGDAAVYCNPFQIDSIVDGLIQLDSNAELREDLIQKGFERAKLFSWDFTAEKIWTVIENQLKK